LNHKNQTPFKEQECKSQRERSNPRLRTRLCIPVEAFLNLLAIILQAVEVHTRFDLNLQAIIGVQLFDLNLQAIIQDDSHYEPCMIRF